LELDRSIPTERCRAKDIAKFEPSTSR
jgi:hypothetical protein